MTDKYRSLLLEMYTHMRRARALDDRMHILVRQARAHFVVSCAGHEAVQAASTMALDRQKDWLVNHYRGLTNALVMGLTAKEWMLAVFAKADDPLSGGRNIPGGCFSYRRLRIAGVSQVVASWIPKAAGIAYASRLRNDGSVVLCTFGDGATSKGDFHEGLNFAAIHNLPVVFVCENNGYAISVPLRLQTANGDIATRAAGYGMPGVIVDGGDAEECYGAAVDAVKRARKGDGPTLIEAKLQRINSHTSEDGQERYRDPREIEDARLNDPVTRLESSLIERGWLAREAADELVEALAADAAEAADWAERQPDPVPEEYLLHVFA